MKLKPCPFCGGRAIYRFNCGEIWLKCSLCHAQFQSYRINGESLTKERKELKKLWNRRQAVRDHANKVKRERCPWCAGRGKVRMSSCYCEECNKMGWLSCVFCDGTGRQKNPPAATRKKGM